MTCFLGRGKALSGFIILYLSHNPLAFYAFPTILVHLKKSPCHSIVPVIALRDLGEVRYKVTSVESNTCN